MKISPNCSFYLYIVVRAWFEVSVGHISPRFVIRPLPDGDRRMTRVRTYEAKVVSGGFCRWYLPMILSWKAYIKVNLGLVVQGLDTGRGAPGSKSRKLQKPQHRLRWSVANKCLGLRTHKETVALTLRTSSVRGLRTSKGLDTHIKSSWDGTSRVYGPKDFVVMVSSIKVVTVKGF